MPIGAGIFAILGGIAGFKGGKKYDQKKAIEKIEEQRYENESGEQEKSGETIKK